MAVDGRSLQQRMVRSGSSCKDGVKGLQPYWLSVGFARPLLMHTSTILPVFLAFASRDSTRLNYCIIPHQTTTSVSTFRQSRSVFLSEVAVPAYGYSIFDMCMIQSASHIAETFTCPSYGLRLLTIPIAPSLQWQH